MIPLTEREWKRVRETVALLLLHELLVWKEDLFVFIYQFYKHVVVKQMYRMFFE